MNGVAKDVGSRVRYYRKQKNISQEKLAELCSLHPTYIGQVERGEKNASIESIYKISCGLGIPVSRLFEKMDGNLTSNSLPNRAYSLMMTMDQAHQELMLSLMETALRFSK